jgi:hypothetical protein
VTLRRASRRAAAGAVALAAGATALAAAAAPGASASLTASPAPAATPAPVATASFTAPVELAAAQFGLAATSATDAAGTTTALITGSGAPKLLERPAGAAWPAPTTRLPGDPRGTKGPVIAAAGQGALAIAWRVDTPRKYGGIQAAVRDPGGTLSTPIDIAGNDANGVRHPALAVDFRGDALLAYNTDTRKSHLSIRGAIAVTYRRAHGSFSTPVVVDNAPSQPPVVALAPDGTGIVAWARGTRVYGFSITRRRLGQVRRLAVSKGIDSLAAAAGPFGEATVAWIGRADSRRYEVRAVHRYPGRAFGPVRVVRSTRAFVSQLALAADETGQTTAAWPEDDFSGPAGTSHITSSVRTATAEPRHGFGRSRALTANGTRSSQSLSLAAANGRVAVAWGYKRDSRHVGVEATVGRPNALAPPQTIAAVTLGGNFFVTTPSAHVTLAPSGAATALAVLPTEPAPRQIASRLVAIDG